MNNTKPHKLKNPKAEKPWDFVLYLNRRITLLRKSHSRL